MNRKHIYILAGIFLILAAVNFSQKIQSSKSSLGEVRHEEWHPFVPVEKAAKILFLRPGFSDLILVKDGKGWKVETLSGVSADSVKVNELLNQLNQLAAELRVEGESLFDRFGISDQAAFHVQILDENSHAFVDFLIGSHRTGSGAFIRLSGKTKIYSTVEDVLSWFGVSDETDQAEPQPNFFADLRLVPETFEQIQRFETAEFRNGKKVTLAALERPATAAGTPWNFVSTDWKFSVGPEKIEDYLGRVIGAHADSVATKAENFKNEFEIMLRDERGKVLRLQFSKAEKGWLAKRENSAVIFEVSNWVFEDLKIQDVFFFEKNPLHFEINEESTVQLSHDGKTETFSKVSGWPSAAAILDAASRLSFLSVVPDIQAKDLAILPPTHQLRVLRTGFPEVTIGFYVTDPKLTQIKTVISGQDPVYIVSRDFFDDIFVTKSAPPKPEALASGSH